MIERYLAIGTAVVVTVLIGVYVGPLAMGAFLIGLLFLGSSAFTL